MLLIVGLGNPGKQYENTRHNTGFFLLDKIKEKWEFPEFEFNKKFNAEVSKNSIGEKEIILAKPQTFMNLSGTTVRAVLDFYKLAPEDIIVIHDDIDIQLGKYKIATDSSSAGHNGVQNIIDTLGTQKFKRIRIGVGKNTEEKEACIISAHDYVLGEFSEKELEEIKKISEDILGEIEKIV